jgi:hypothetical protein
MLLQYQTRSVLGIPEPPHYRVLMVVHQKSRARGAHHGHRDKMKILSSIYKSLVRSVVDLIDEINAVNLTDSPMQYISWDSRYDEDKLPATTLLGIDGFTWTENKGLWVTRYGLGLSSYRDANLLNEIDIIDKIHAATGEHQKIRLLDPETGDEIAEMVTAAWELAPMAQSQMRNYRTISIELLRTANG